MHVSMSRFSVEYSRPWTNKAINTFVSALKERMEILLILPSVILTTTE